MKHLIHSQQDQRKHIRSIQPHNIAALHDHILHQTVAHGKREHKYRTDPVGKTALQIPAEGRTGRPQFQGNCNIKKLIDAFFSKEIQKKIKRRCQIIAEQTNRTSAKHIAEIIGQRPGSVQNIYIICKEIDILDLRIINSSRLGTKGFHSQFEKDEIDNPKNCKERNAAQKKACKPVSAHRRKFLLGLLSCDAPVRVRRHSQWLSIIYIICIICCQRITHTGSPVTSSKLIYRYFYSFNISFYATSALLATKTG